MLSANNAFIFLICAILSSSYSNPDCRSPPASDSLSSPGDSSSDADTVAVLALAGASPAEVGLELSTRGGTIPGEDEVEIGSGVV